MTIIATWILVASYIAYAKALTLMNAKFNPVVVDTRSFTRRVYDSFMNNFVRA